MRNLKSILVTVAIVLIALTTSCTKEEFVPSPTPLDNGSLNIEYLFKISKLDTTALNYFILTENAGRTDTVRDTLINNDLYYQVRYKWISPYQQPRIIGVVNDSCKLEMYIFVGYQLNNSFCEYVGAGEYELKYQ